MSAFPPPANKSPTDLLTTVAAKAALPVAALASVRKWIAGQLVAQEFAKLGQGGHKESQIPLRTVFVDLPISHSVRSFHLEHREQLLAQLMIGKPIEFSAALELSKSEKGLSETLQGEPTRDFSATLLIGGPGQGKSTIGQLASQLHRAHLLQESINLLNPRQVELVRSLAPNNKSRSKNELATPRRHMFPLTLELPKVAVWLGEQKKSNLQTNSLPRLISYIASLPSAKEVALRPEDLWEFCRRIPVFIVLDGFDEVGATKDRDAVVSAAKELFSALAQSGNTGQILATTRPQGYAEEFEGMGIRLSKWYLLPLEQEEALTYARKLVEAKIDGADLQQQTLARLEEAAREPATQRLLSTPLQVTILTALVQQLGGVPRERWNLFSRYFSYTYDREIERKSYASSILHSHRNHIERIHSRVALLLQVEAELVGGAEARMSRQRLEEVILEVLKEDEIAEETQDRLIAQIAKAAQERLVFLVEPEPGKFGFEIRSLQEFMAAWALTDGRDDEVIQRMGQVAKSSMFRNVLIFIASRLYSTSSPLRENIGRVCDDLNSGQFDEVAGLGRAGSVLAADIIEEGAISAQPRQSRALMERAVQLLETPLISDQLKLVNIIDDDNESVAIAAITKIVGQSKTVLPGLDACWNCLIALDAAGKSWAFDILAANFMKFANTAGLLQKSAHSSVEISARVQSLIEGHSAHIDVADVINFSCAEREAGQSVSWLAALSATLGFKSERGYRGPINRLTDGMISNAPLPPATPAPEGWEHLSACLRFETSPSSKTLAIALRAVAAKGDDRIASWLPFRCSWPLATCLNMAEDAGQLLRWASMLEAGDLGDIDTWSAAEASWSTMFDFEKSLEATDLELPWKAAGLSIAPPVMAHPIWVIRFNRQRSIKLALFRQLDGLVNRTSNQRLKRQVVSMGFALLEGLSAKTLVKTIDLSQWLNINPSAVTFLSARPPVLDTKTWLTLIENVNPKTWDLWSASPLAILASFQNSPWHPLAVETLAISMGIHGRHAHRMMLTDPSALTAAIRYWKESPPQNILASARVVSIAYLAGLVPVENDEQALAVFAFEANKEPHRWAELLGALRYSGIDDFRAERIVVRAFKLDPRSAILAESLRDRLQSRKSGLDTPGAWTRLNLPSPRPHYPTDIRDEVQVSQRSPIHISSVSLTDVGRLKSLTLKPAASDQSLGQWVVVLGPNGTGKSTLLKSIALGLRNLKNPAIWPKGTFSSFWRRITRGNTSAQEAVIDIGIHQGLTYTSKLRADDVSAFEQLPQRSAVSPFPVFAYGCRRGSALGGGPREVNINSDDGPEISTLFDEDAHLVHAETWLVQLEGDVSKTSKSARIFGAVVEALKALLELESIEISDKKVWVKERHGPKLHLSALSDGYLTTAGWFLDLVARWVEHPDHKNEDFDDQFLVNMTGVVLIDEIDLHLHPQWQMDVISRTRKVLPRMTFWVTTHNPLCLVGAKAEEIWILDGRGEETEIAPGKEAPLLLTGGQIYKKYFGIRDIYPDDIGRAMQRYAFLFSYDGKTEAETKELAELASQLAERGVLPDWSTTVQGVEGRHSSD